MKVIAAAAMAIAIVVAGLTGGSATAATAVLRSSSPPDDVLNGVTCVTDKDCIAVGFSNDNGATIVDRWNGKAWQRSQVPQPAGGNDGSLDAVSCAPGGAACMATGEFTPRKWAVSGDYTGLADRWNGKTWTATAVSGTEGVELQSVSCPASDYCLAVGTYQQPGTEATKGIAYQWNGARWTRVNPVVPHGGTSQLSSVSCTSATFCVAVGGTARVSLAYRWNGKSWASTKPATPTGDLAPLLAGVSCVSPTDCTAVSNYQDGATGYVERWNGTSWKASAPTSFQGDGAGTFPSGVSCLSADYCMAVGDISEGDTGGEAGAWAWNGKQWTEATVPDDGDYSDNTFNSISCLSWTFCVAVGSYTSVYPPILNGAQGGFWNGHRWYLDTPS